MITPMLEKKEDEGIKKIKIKKDEIMRARFMERSIISSEGVERTLLGRWEKIDLMVDELVFILNLFQFCEW